MDQSAQTDRQQKAQEDRRRAETISEQQQMRTCQTLELAKQRDQRLQCARVQRHLG